MKNLKERLAAVTTVLAMSLVVVGCFKEEDTVPGEGERYCADNPYGEPCTEANDPADLLGGAAGTEGGDTGGTGGRGTGGTGTGATGTGAEAGETGISGAAGSDVGGTGGAGQAGGDVGGTGGGVGGAGEAGATGTSGTGGTTGGSGGTGGAGGTGATGTTGGTGGAGGTTGGASGVGGGAGSDAGAAGAGGAVGGTGGTAGTGGTSGTSGTGGTGGTTVVCPPNTLTCGTECVDPTSDEDNCGGCGIQCQLGEQCILSRCYPPCPPDEPGITWRRCPDNPTVCVNIQSDPAHCGDCQNTCFPGESCDLSITPDPCVAPPPVCIPSPEICNGRDDDCDGVIDDGLGVNPPDPCSTGIGACERAGYLVCNAMGGVVCNAAPGLPATAEICNGIDDDCNGQTDEWLGTVTCGYGVCRHPVNLCDGGLPGVCDPFEGAGTEVCDNGLDDDCDGYADCADPECSASCTEVCNGADDNNNGLVDEFLGSTWCGLGECIHEQPNCVDGSSEVCDPNEGSSTEVCDNGLDDDCDGYADCHDPDCAADTSCVETCNGVDDDQDGSIDELLGTTWCGLGECHHEEDNCVGGMSQACNPMQDAVTEVCDNGLDDDCDGYRDCNDPDCATDPSCTEVCNGADDDGDGSVDEFLGTTWCGLGQCFHKQKNCEGGVPQICDPNEGAASEDCGNGLDDDCDGYPDCNDTECAGSADCTEICNGADDDNDGSVDEFLGSTWCGLGECFHEQENCDVVPQVCDPNEGSTLEVCDNGLDDDCDGYPDCNDTDCVASADCIEVCNGADDDGNSLIDENLGVTVCGLGECEHTQDNCVAGVAQPCEPMLGSSAEICDSGLDEDCDGYVDCADTDCVLDPACP